MPRVLLPSWFSAYLVYGPGVTAPLPPFSRHQQDGSSQDQQQGKGAKEDDPYQQYGIPTHIEDIAGLGTAGINRIPAIIKPTKHIGDKIKVPGPRRMPAHFSSTHKVC